MIPVIPTLTVRRLDEEDAVALTPPRRTQPRAVSDAIGRTDTNLRKVHQVRIQPLGRADVHNEGLRTFSGGSLEDESHRALRWPGQIASRSALRSFLTMRSCFRGERYSTKTLP